VIDKAVFVIGRFWSSGNVKNPDAPIKRHLSRYFRILRAGENIHRYAQISEFSARLADIHVHPAGFLATEGG
jgi:hypothetical protein